MTAGRCLSRLRAKYFAGAWNLGSVKLAAALAMIAAALALAGWGWLATLSGSAGLGAPGAAIGCLLLGLAFLAAAALYDARTVVREPLSRRSPNG
jgi:hypothetical protein